MASANSRQVGGYHYASPIQHWDFVIANDMPYMEAQIFKYVFRHRMKGGISDLEKARHFLDKLIEVEQQRADARKIVENVLWRKGRGKTSKKRSGKRAR